MKLGDCKTKTIGSLLQFTKQTTDEQGSGDYELTITGPPSLTRKIFDAADIELTIRPRATEEEAQAAMKELAKRSAEGLHQILDAPYALHAKPPAKPPANQNSVYVALRRTKGKGTFWILTIPSLFVPAGASIFFLLPPVLSTMALVLPAAGDADLFLSLNLPFPAVQSSRLGGLLPDSVAFTLLPFIPWYFVPFVRVFGFRRSVTFFTMNGFSIP
jgi:hypothetical protein